MESDAAGGGRSASATLVALVVAAAAFMQNLDGAIINTSLPQMAATFHVTAVGMNTGVTAYILALAIFTPISGWLSERLGAKRVFAAAVAIFTLASVGCSMAGTLPQFIVARVVQGFGGALMTPVGRTLILRAAKPSELLQATALITWPALIAPVIAPVIGGAITAHLGWRWNFLLNLPLGLVGVGLVLAVVPDIRDSERKPLDLVGAILSAASLFLLVYGLDSLSLARSATRPVLLAGLGAAFAVASVLWLRRHRHALVDLAAFRIPTFAATNLGSGNLFRIAINATPFLLPLMMQAVWGFDPLRAGWWLLIYFFGNLAMKSVTTPILRRFGFRPVLLVNGAGIAASVGACGLLSPSTPGVLTGLVLFAAGATRSMQFTSLNTLTFADIPAPQRASSSTLAAVLNQLAAAIAVALAAVLLNLSREGRGAAALSQADFRLAFLTCGLIAAVGVGLCLRLAPDAGAAVSGRGRA